MTIEAREITGKGVICDPDILVSGMQVTIAPRLFRFAGQDYELTEEVNVTFQTEPHRQLVHGYLAREVATGDITVVYDVEGPDDEAYIQQPGDPYQFIEWIIIIDIPPGTTDLDLVTVKVKRAVAEEQDGQGRGTP